VPSVAFSDLERARALSRRLEGMPARTVPPPDEPKFVRFHRKALPMASAPPALDLEPARTNRTGATETPDVVGYGARRWGVLANWLLEQTSARASLLMDSHGLLLAVEGPMDVPEVEGVGAHLMEALAQASKMFAEKPPGMRIDISFGEFHLVGFEVDAGDVGLLTVGLLGTSPVSPERCVELRQHVENALELESVAAESYPE
jgi:hypothetical protein